MLIREPKPPSIGACHSYQRCSLKSLFFIIMSITTKHALSLTIHTVPHVEEWGTIIQVFQFYETHLAAPIILHILKTPAVLISLPVASLPKSWYVHIANCISLNNAKFVHTTAHSMMADVFMILGPPMRVKAASGTRSPSNSSYVVIWSPLAEEEKRQRQSRARFACPIITCDRVRRQIISHNNIRM